MQLKQRYTEGREVINANKFACQLKEILDTHFLVQHCDQNNFGLPLTLEQTRFCPTLGNEPCITFFEHHITHPIKPLAISH